MYKLKLKLFSMYQSLLNDRFQNIYRYLVISSLRDDDIGIAFGRFNKLQVHGLYSFLITFEHLNHCSASLGNIPVYNPAQPVIRICIHINFYILQFQ